MNIIRLKNHVETDTETDIQGNPVLAKVRSIRAKYHDEGCVISRLEGKPYGNTGKIGGWQIYHGRCHPGRIDAIVTPPTLLIGGKRG